MPIPTDYSSMVTEIGNYLQRPDLTAEIPTYLYYAEERVGDDLRVESLLGMGTLTISPNGNSVALSGLTGYIGMVSVKVTSGNRLLFITPDTRDQADANTNGMVTPLMWTHSGDNLYVSPTWVAGGTLTCQYYKREPKLSGSNTTNWYVTKVPHMLQYAALLEAASFLRDEQAMAKWFKHYEYARDRANDRYGVTDPGMRAMMIEAGKGKALTPTL
jgi:hypothetical protein